jgi:hypothetical protein
LAAAFALLVGENETAAGYEANAALREGMFGNPAEAKQRAEAALAQTLASGFAKSFPQDTIVKFNTYRRLPDSSRSAAMSLVRPSMPCKAPVCSSWASPEMQRSCPLYIPSMYAEKHVERRIKDARPRRCSRKFSTTAGSWSTNPSVRGRISVLPAACALQADTAQARSAYQDFLTLWKDADPDVPILKQARTEYAKLHSRTGTTPVVTCLSVAD